MPQVNLILDYFSGNAVVSLSDLSIAALPRFVQGDSLDIKLWILQRVPGIAPSFLPTANVSIFMALGNLLPDPPTYLTNQGTWTPSGDASNPFFEATLPMNTAGINSALTAAAASGKRYATVDFGVTFYVSGAPTCAILKSVPLYKALIAPSALIVPAGQQAATLAAVEAMLLNITTNSVTIVSPDGTHRRRLWEDNDGTPHDDQG